MRRIGALVVLACAVAAAGAAAAFLVAGTARAGPEDCADGGCPTTTTVTTTTAPPTTTAPVTTTEPPPTVTAPPPPPTTTVTPTEPDTPPRRHRRPRPARPPSTRPAPVKAPSPAAPRITRATPPLRGGPYVFPVYGPVSFSDTFGAPRADTTWHQGGDIFAPLGAPVLAVADGTLFVVGWNRVGGYRLWLRDRRGNFFYYAHLSAFSSLSVAGARVRAGTVVGFVGNTGDAGGTPYHLHFEIHPASLISQGYSASAVNPTSYLRSWKRAQSFRLGAGDARLARSTGWAAAVALPSAVPAPAPAVLLQVNDISRAAGLAPKQVKQAFAPPAHRTQLRPLWRPRAQNPVVVFDPRARAQARKARSLDRGAQLPLGLPTVWDTLAQCEAGGNWSTNTGNGFYGGLQFTPGTWLAHGGAEFAPSAEQATREQQILVAERVLADQGWVAWPACSLKLGLR